MIHYGHGIVQPPVAQISSKGLHIMQCEHDRYKVGIVTKDVGIHKFSCCGLICVDCGNQLWDNEIEDKFQEWMSKLPRIMITVSPEVYLKIQTLANLSDLTAEEVVDKIYLG